MVREKGFCWFRDAREGRSAVGGSVRPKRLMRPLGGSVRLKRPKRPLGGSVRLKRPMRPLGGSVRLKRLMRPMDNRAVQISGTTGFLTM
jgi:hypothetical protein